MAARAQEVFEQVKGLSLEERAELSKLMQTLDESAQPAAKPFKIPDYAAQLKEDFPEGIVIHDPQAFWDELRAERIEFVR